MAYNQSERTAADPFPRRSVLVALASLLALFAVLLSGHGSWLLQSIEQRFYDFRTSFFSDRIGGDYPDVVLVSVGGNVSATRATFDPSRGVEVDRGQLARLIDVLDDSAPRAIGFDVPLAGATDPVKDAALQRALREAKARVILAARTPPQTSTGQTSTGQTSPGTTRPETTAERRVWQERFVSGTGRRSGHITTLYDEYLGRAVAIDSGAQALSNPPDSFALLMARALRPETKRIFGNISWLQKVDESGWFSRYLNLGGQQPFPMLYGDDLIDSTKPLPTRQLAGRLVLVTTGLAEIERHRTPLSVVTGESLAPIQIQAQAIAQGLDGRGVAELEPRALRVLLFTLACLAGLVGWYRGPGWHIVGTVVAVVVLIVADMMAYSLIGLALPLVPALIVWLLGETAGRCLRRILRWEERHGHHWPLEESAGTERIIRAS